MEALQHKIAAVRRRLAFLQVLDWSLRGMFFGLVAALLLISATKFFNESFDPLLVSAAIVGAAVILTGSAAWFRRLSLFEAAMQADSRLALRERLSSAYILAGRGSADPAVAALTEDAADFARKIEVGRDFQFSPPPHAKFLAVPLAAMLIVHFFVNDFSLFNDPPPLTKQEQKKTEAETVRKMHAELIRKIAEDAKAGSLDENDELGRISKDLERLSRDVALGTKDPKSAAAEMSRMNEEVKLNKRQMERNQESFKAISGLNRAKETRELRSEMKDQNFEGAAKELEDLAAMLENTDSMNAEQLKDLAEELKDLAEQTKDNPAASEALAQAAQAVQAAAQAAQQEQSGAQQNQANSSPDASSQQQQQGNQGQPQSQPGGEKAPGLPGIQAANALRQASSAMQNQADAKEMIAKLDQVQAQMQQQQGQMAQQGQQGQQQQGQQQQSGQQGQQGQSQQGQGQQGNQQGQQGQQSQSGDGQQQGQQGNQAQGEGNSQGQGQQGQSSEGQSGQSGQSGQQGQQGQGQQGQGQGQDGQGGDGQQPGQGEGQGQGQGQWNSQMNPNEGQGSGAGGRGRGGKPPDDGSEAIGFSDTLIPGQKNDGEIIAVIQIDAPAPVGESNVQYKNVYNAYQQKASDTMKNDVIPVTYRNAVRDYFQAINPQQQRPADTPKTP